VLVALFAIAGLWAGFGVDGYRIIEGAAPDGPSNPLAKQVAVVPVEWFHNYITRPFALLGSALGLIAPIMAIGLLFLGMNGAAFVASSAAVVGVVAAPGLAMFPFILPSPTGPQSHRLGFVLQSVDAVDHAGRDGGADADRNSLHDLGVPGAAWQVDRGGSRKRRVSVLTEEASVMWEGCRARIEP
jgi:hypothetical protein